MTRAKTKTEQLALDRLLLNLRAFEDERVLDYAVRDNCPEAWDTLEADLPVRERKVHLTLRLDASVASYFRAMGPGYQARINRVLATYAQMKITKVRRFEAEFAEFERTGRGPWDRDG